MGTKKAFVIAKVGASNSVDRTRADEIYTHVLSPLFEEFDITGYRADKDPTPGSITDRLIRELVEADLVVVDLTGMNPNVFYELGVAHSFNRRVVTIADTTEGLPFDNKDQRTISLGEYPDSGLPVTQAENAKHNIREAIRAVLQESYSPTSPVKGAVGIASLDSLAEDDPVASELAQIRDQVELLAGYVVDLSRPAVSSSARRDSRVARAVAEDLAAHPGRILNPATYAEYEMSEQSREWINLIRELQVAHRDIPDRADRTTSAGTEYPRRTSGVTSRDAARREAARQQAARREAVAEDYTTRRPGGSVARKRLGGSQGEPEGEH
ncbi:hypothetical protein Bra3105_18345 (plasmid) [Brachybacterium halotolerans subsp. kimchii]|uniref:hypothetical protein n=1 Tax=Brachybacterium halotolerans TaxID=2795215 RepID=UPI001E53D2C8|nr:hypothetical protein [Brachybacterium halotolerans]UEJ84626.1 hypothetical protein Bra3105_18345 [Brachybacterium halotolerans subsp. kimchii]